MNNSKLNLKENSKSLIKSFLISFILILIISPQLICQVPNSGFENWTNGNPDCWVTDNDPADGVIPVTPTTTAHSGSYALEGNVVSDQGFSINPLIQTVFPYHDRPTNFSGYFKFNSVGADSMVILISLESLQDSAGAGGGGSMVVKNTVDNYTEFNIPIYWVSQNPPDSCVISVTIYPQSLLSHVGTKYEIDDLSLNNNTTNVSYNSDELPDNFYLSQNYPNPFNPSTKIRFRISESGFVTLKVYNILGKQVASLVNGNKTTGNYEVDFHASNLPSGLYFYRLTVLSADNQYEKFSSVKKMLLLK